jgi:chromosome segregation ATPase
MCADYMARQVASHANGMNGELSSTRGDLERVKLQAAETLQKLHDAEGKATSNRQRLQELEAQLSSSREESDSLRAKLSQAVEAKSEFSGFVISCSSLCSSAQCKPLTRMLLQGMWRRC